MYNMPLICITCHSSSFSIFTGPSFPCVGCDCTSFDHSGDHFHENFELALPKNQQKYIWGQPSFCHWFGHLCESNFGRVRCGFGRIETHPHQKKLARCRIFHATVTNIDVWSSQVTRTRRPLTMWPSIWFNESSTSSYRVCCRCTLLDIISIANAMVQRIINFVVQSVLPMHSVGHYS